MPTTPELMFDGIAILLVIAYFAYVLLSDPAIRKGPN